MKRKLTLSHVPLYFHDTWVHPGAIHFSKYEDRLGFHALALLLGGFLLFFRRVKLGLGVFSQIGRTVKRIAGHQVITSQKSATVPVRT